MRHLTIVGEIVDQAATSAIYEAFKANAEIHGLRIVVLGRGDQVTEPMEVCEAVANLDPFCESQEVKELIQQATKSMMPEK